MEGVQNRGLIGTGEGGVIEGRVSAIKFSTFWSLQLLILQNFAWPNLIFIARQNSRLSLHYVITCICKHVMHTKTRAYITYVF